MLKYHQIWIALNHLIAIPNKRLSEDFHLQGVVLHPKNLDLTKRTIIECHSMRILIKKTIIHTIKLKSSSIVMSNNNLVHLGETNQCMKVQKPIISKGRGKERRTCLVLL